jgi:hypothetical protein
VRWIVADNPYYRIGGRAYPVFGWLCCGCGENPEIVKVPDGYLVIVEDCVRVPLDQEIPYVYTICTECGHCEYSRYTMVAKKNKVLNDPIDIMCDTCGNRPLRHMVIPIGYMYVFDEKRKEKV